MKGFFYKVVFSEEDLDWRSEICFENVSFTKSHNFERWPSDDSILINLYHISHIICMILKLPWFFWTVAKFATSLQIIVQIISQESFGLCYPDSTGQPDAVLNRDVMCRHTRGITLFKAGNPLSMGSWLPEFTCFYYFLPAFSPMIAKWLDTEL